MVPWPPQYTIRKHKLTKNVKLIASKRQGLVISVPARFNARQIPAILEDHKNWIISQITKITDVVPLQLPATFFSMEKTWQVSFQQCKLPLKIIERPHQEVVLIGGNTNQQAQCKLLTLWLRNKASKYLKAMLSHISQESGFSYRHVTVRNQTTRWGSCNAERDISLNYKLIFFPYPLMRHVILHELCHTIHLNHSPCFWRLLGEHDRDYVEHRRALREANQHVPAWVVD